MRFDGLLFDFDGVLIESEYAGNRHLAELLTAAGHPTTPEDSMAHFMGLAGDDFRDAIRRWIGGPLPADFEAARAAEDARAMAEGVDAVEGAVAFVRALSRDLPKAVVSSSYTRWIRRHLDHIGLADVFGDHVYSGREHVSKGKPAPDLYWYGARAIGVPIERCAILEDSPGGAPRGVGGGGVVLGLGGGPPCGARPAARLRAIGVDAIARDFTEVADLVGL